MEGNPVVVIGCVVVENCLVVEGWVVVFGTTTFTYSGTSSQLVS